jgi:hypothetical protein
MTATTSVPAADARLLRGWKRWGLGISGARGLPARLSEAILSIYPAGAFGEPGPGLEGRVHGW